MSETLAARLRVVLYCHVPSVTISVGSTPLDRERFPAAREGFDDFPMVREVGYSGTKLTLVDISGLTDREVIRRLKVERNADIWTDPVRLLQAFEYLDGPFGLAVHPGIAISTIVAYQVDPSHNRSEVVVAERLPDGGFKRMASRNPLAPWEPETVGLFYIDGL